MLHINERRCFPLSNYKRTQEHKASENSGIYCITNLINNKRYIGQTYNLSYRWRRHLCDLRHNNHSNNHLQASFNKYGEQSFDYSILEKCSLIDLDEKEKYWIKIYNSLENGYNQADGGLGCRGYKHTESELAKMRAVHNPDPVLQYSESGELITKWESASQAGKSLKLYSLAIKNCCEQKFHVKSVGGYIWIYEKDSSTIDMSYYFNKAIKTQRNILQFNFNMILVREWNSLYQASKETGVSTRSIASVCSRKRKSSHGFVWRYSNEYRDDEYRADIKFYSSYYETRKSKPVDKYDCFGTLIETYKSITSAAKACKLDKGSISDCCNGKKDTHAGFIWKYATK